MSGAANAGGTAPNEGGDSVSTAMPSLPDEQGDFTTTTEVEVVTGEDIGAITSNWFDSFPAALPISIRNRLLAQLEEFVVDPQVSISLVREEGKRLGSALLLPASVTTYLSMLLKP